MVWRVCRFLLYQLAGSLIGYWWLPFANRVDGALLGVIVAGICWVLLDLWRGYRLLAWLGDTDAADAPSLVGLWGLVVDRMRRQLRRREQRSAESERQLREFLAAIQASPNGVVLLDREGRIEWCNQTAAAHFGFELPRDLMQHVGNLVRDPAFAQYQGGSDFSRDVVIPGPASTNHRPVRLSVHLHRYGEGRKLLMSRDVTALEQAEAMRRDFVANVSHEIRTPLTVLGGLVETLQTLTLDGAERQHYLAMMAQQAQRMQILVNDLLTLSRLEGSPLPRLDEWVDVRPLIEQCAQEARNLSMMLTEMEHEVSIQIGHDCALAGSQAELISAMANLVNNAIRYTPAGGKIQLLWDLRSDGTAEFAVSDNGPGIAPEHLPRLTERFYRVDHSRSRETGGTGLGLAIVKHVAQRHGAQLRISSTPGQGSTFSIDFPAQRVRPALTTA